MIVGQWFFVWEYLTRAPLTFDAKLLARSVHTVLWQGMPYPCTSLHVDDTVPMRNSLPVVCSIQIRWIPYPCTPSSVPMGNSLPVVCTFRYPETYSRIRGYTLPVDPFSGEFLARTVKCVRNPWWIPYSCYTGNSLRVQYAGRNSLSHNNNNIIIIIVSSRSPCSLRVMKQKYLIPCLGVNIWWSTGARHNNEEYRNRSTSVAYCVQACNCTDGCIN